MKHPRCTSEQRQTLTSDLFALPLLEIKPTFLICQHRQLHTVLNQCFLVKRPSTWLCKRGDGIRTLFPPLFWQSKLQTSADGGGRSCRSAVVASCPDGKRPPGSDHHSQATLTGEGCELQSTTTADSAKSNSEERALFLIPLLTGL